MTGRGSDSGLDGILLIDKPAGWTSHDVVARARRLTGQRRIGHTGTLDPMATGLLVLCLGQATRLVEYMVGHGKRYTGSITLGRTTTTDDAEGETAAERPVPPLTQAAVEACAARFTGEIRQRPPAYSALKVGGQRAYAAARAGKTVELAERTVTITRFEARLTGERIIDITVDCSSGTYIRSLARDLGEALGCGGHLSALRREASGPFAVADALTLEALERVARAGRLDEFVLACDEGIAGMEAAILGAEGVLAVTNGRAWDAPERCERAANPARIYGDGGDFVGVGSVDSAGEIRPLKVLLRPNLR